MGAARQPAEHVFGPDDRQRERPRSAVQGRADKGAARLDQGAQGGKELIEIGNVLDDLEGEDGIEALAGTRQRSDIRNAVIDREPARLGVVAGRGDRLRVGVDPGDPKAEPGHRLGDEAAAAADIGEAEAGEGGERAIVAAELREQLPADKIDADGVYAVERLKAAPCVPPVRTLRGEPSDVLRVYRIAEFMHFLGSAR